MAEFTSGSLKLSESGLDKDYSQVTVACGGSCLQCRYGAQTEEEFTYIAGDILLAGKFSTANKDHSG